jgi:hypothetical protein
VTLAGPLSVVEFRVYIEINVPEADLWFGWYRSEGAESVRRRFAQNAWFSSNQAVTAEPHLHGFALVSVRKQVESSESFVIQVWWPDSRRVTDVDGEEPQTIRPQRIAIS